jgi:hypothetical protein
MILLLFGSVSNNWIMKKVDTSATSQIGSVIIPIAADLTALSEAAPDDTPALLSSISTSSENLDLMNTFCEDINNAVNIISGGIRTSCDITLDLCTLYGTKGETNDEENGSKKKIASDMLAVAVTLLSIGFGVAVIFVFLAPPYVLLRTIPVGLVLFATIIALIGVLMAKNALSATTEQTTAFNEGMESFKTFTAGLFAAEELVSTASFSPASTNIPECKKAFLEAEEVPKLSSLSGMDFGAVITILGTLFCFLADLVFLATVLLEWRKLGFSKSNLIELDKL